MIYFGYFSFRIIRLKLKSKIVLYFWSPLVLSWNTKSVSKVVKLLIFLKNNTILDEHIACNVYSSSSGAYVIYP